jgi:hypothetical protein
MVYDKEIDNQVAVLDIRELIERIEELEEVRDEEPEQFTSDLKDELEQISTFVESMEGYGGDHQWRGDWYPATLIRHDHFEEYIDEMLEDIGVMPKDIPSYMTIQIDYDMLKMDYSSADYDGVEYYYR